MSGVTVGRPAVTRRSARARQRELRPLGTLNRVFRFLVGLAMIAGGAYLILIQEQFRRAEAGVVTLLLKPFLGDGVFQLGDQFVVRLDPAHYVGLQITVECTTLVLLTPMLLFSAAVLMFTRVTWLRWALASVVGFAIVAIVNAFRIALIAFSTLWWDEAGYEWSHILLGTVVALIGLVGAALLMLRIMNGPRRGKKKTATAADQETGQVSP